MATNNFGDNWLSDEEQNYWGVDSHGQPLKSEQKSERQLDNEAHWKESRENVSFWTIATVACGVALFWIWMAIELVLKFGFVR